MVRYKRLGDNGCEDSTVVIIEEDLRIDPIKKSEFGISSWLVLILIHVLWILTLPLTWWLSFKVIPQYQRVLIFRLGRMLPLKGPGLIFIIPLVDRWIITDMRMRAFSVPPHKILTIDGRQIEVGAEVQYRIIDPVRAHGLVQDLDHTLRVSAHSVLNRNLACRKGCEIESEKNFLSIPLQNSMNAVASTWGVEIARFEISQVLRSPQDTASDESFQDPMLAIMNVIKGMAHSSGASSFNSFTAATGPVSTTPQLQASPAGSNTKALLTPCELFEMLKVAIDQKTAHEINAVYLFDISGENGGQWTIDFRKEPFVIKKGGQVQDVDVTFHLSDKLFIDILYQKASVTDAYFGGSLTVDGSAQIAMRIEKLVRSLQKASK